MPGVWKEFQTQGKSYKVGFCNFMSSSINYIRHMALHDPESTAQEKAMALKIGRQKKIQIIDGQRVIT